MKSGSSLANTAVLLQTIPYARTKALQRRADIGPTNFNV